MKNEATITRTIRIRIAAPMERAGFREARPAPLSFERARFHRFSFFGGSARRGGSDLRCVDREQSSLPPDRAIAVPTAGPARP
jgi:hypothetical protein